MAGGPRQSPPSDGDLRLDLLMEQIPAALWTTDTEPRITFASGAALGTIGEGPQPGGGATVDEYFGARGDPEHAVVAAHRRALAGESVSYTVGRKGRLFDAHVQPLRDPEGEIVGVVGVALDITDRERARRELERQSARVRLLQRAAIAANEATGVDEALGEVLRLVGEHARWPVGHALRLGPQGGHLASRGQWWTSDEHAVDALREASDAIVFGPGEGMIGEVLASGRPAWRVGLGQEPGFLRREAARASGMHSAFAIPVLVGDEVAAVLEFFHPHLRPRDEALLEVLSNVGAQLGRVVERERAAELGTQLQQAQKMEALGRLAGGLAHDFNNLLTVIQGHLELALGDQADREGIQRAARAAARASSLARRLLTFSRRGVSERRVVPLDEVVANMVPMCDRLVGELIEVATELDPATPAVLADRGQLEQVLMNLVVNARDAMPEGGRLSVQTELCEVDSGAPLRAAPGVYACLVVQDTGAGMEPEVRQRIFEPFFTTKGERRGTGLGLATVHGIVQQHGGTVQVDSEPGRGTTFRILLPAAEEQDGAAVPQTLPPGQIRPDVPSGAHMAGVSASVLVVEDEEMLRRLVEQVLRREGHRVHALADAQQALAHLEEHAGEVDLVLSDLVMPGMGGGELAGRIRARWPGIRVILTSGYAEADVPGHEFPPGVPVLHKPFRPGDLIEVVDSVLGQGEG